MKGDVHPGRRRARGARGARRLVVLLLAASSALPLAASDEAIERAKEAALTWVQLADAGKGLENWDASATVFKQRVERARWADILRQVRAPQGRVLERVLEHAEFSTEAQGMPPGEYVTLRYSTRFENMPSAKETLALVLDEDGAFRVAGYFVE